MPFAKQLLHSNKSISSIIIINLLVFYKNSPRHSFFEWFFTLIIHLVNFDKCFPHSFPVQHYNNICYPRWDISNKNPRNRKRYFLEINLSRCQVLNWSKKVNIFPINLSMYLFISTRTLATFSLIRLIIFLITFAISSNYSATPSTSAKTLSVLFFGAFFLNSLNNSGFSNFTRGFYHIQLWDRTVANGCCIMVARPPIGRAHKCYFKDKASLCSGKRFIIYIRHSAVFQWFS